MVRPFRRGRQSARDRQRDLNNAFRLWGDVTGKPQVAYQFIKELPPKRERVVRPVDGRPEAPLEKDIQRAIIEAISLRHDVVFVGRFNRGQAVATNEHGERRYTPFNSVPGFPDIHGLLVGGKAFYLEVKRPPPNYQRPTPEQQRFLDSAKSGGAHAGVATSVEEAMAILP